MQQGRGCEGLSPPPQLLHAHLPTVQAHSPPVVEGAFVNTAPAAGGEGAPTPVLKLKKKGNGIKKTIMEVVRGGGELSKKRQIPKVSLARRSQAESPLVCLKN